MPPLIAAAFFTVVIVGLFVLDRDKDVQTSKALWIPVAWMWIAASRPVSQWLSPIGSIGSARASLANSPSQYVDGSPVDALIFAALLVAGFAVLLNRRRLVGLFLQANGAIVLFYFYCAVAIVWSDFPGVALKRWIKFAGNLVMVLIVLTDPQPLAAFKRFLTRTSFLLVPLSVLAIKYFPDWGRAYDPKPGPWLLMYTGVTANKNELGSLCLIFGLASMWRILGGAGDGEGKERTRHRIAHGAVLVMVFWLLAGSDSMTSLACFIMGCVLITATCLRVTRSRLVLHFLALSMLFLSFYALFLDEGGSLVGTFGRNATLTGRTGLWDMLMGMRGSLLFGTGFESFWLGSRIQTLWTLVWWHPTEAHDGYFETFLNIGWIGVILLVILMAVGYRNVMSAIRRNPGTGGILLAYFVAAAAYNFTESAFIGVNPVWIIFLVTALAIPIKRAAEVPSQTPMKLHDALIPQTEGGYSFSPPALRRARLATKGGGRARV